MRWLESHAEMQSLSVGFRALAAVILESNAGEGRAFRTDVELRDAPAVRHPLASRFERPF